MLLYDSATSGNCYKVRLLFAVLRYWLNYAPQQPSEAEIAAKHAGGEAALRAMERHLQSRRFFVGEAYTIADIALYAYTHTADTSGFDVSEYPAIGAWLARVRDQSGHVPITA
jgi:glutathione S-transferase